jgi:uncharacterized protein (UPF0332 family)
MNPGQFLTFADVIAQSPTSGPAGFRSAISRAYYGAFLEARELIGTRRGFRIDSGGNEHKYLQRLLLNCSVEEGQEIGELLKNLQQSRKEADYDMHLLHCERQAERSFASPEPTSCLSRLMTCSAGMLFTKIQLGIRAICENEQCVGWSSPIRKCRSREVSSSAAELARSVTLARQLGPFEEPPQTP